ncbi:hypothetical protein [Ralstonia sp. Ralssp135]|uniref:hypothetical protein n=1 Tax=Ralstonia sp. Ralssp135 TaxID=3243016 RepID=UPI0039AF4A6E
MVEKIGHVRNPLTVIAIFAGLAEISGTVVLPILQGDVQGEYVLFLMFFPIFLVALFFFVLYKKHYVLYAPKDFNSDETFARLFETIPSAEKLRARGVEVDDSGDGAAAAAGEAIAEDPTGQPIKHLDDACLLSSSSVSAVDTLKRSFRGNGLLAEELVSARLSKELGVDFQRDMAVKGHPNLQFDSVAILDDRAIVVETRFTRNGSVSQERMKSYFEMVQKFSDGLPISLQGRVELVMAIVTDSTDPDKLEKVERLVQRTRELAKQFSFKSSIRFFKMADLEREFAVR